MPRMFLLAFLLGGVLAASPARGQDALEQVTLAKNKLGATKNVHSFGLNLLCSQPAADDFAEAKKRGIKTVITLREAGEIDWDERDAVENLGLEFFRVGFLAPESLTEDIFTESLKLLADKQRSPVMLHCGSANRVGAIWLAHRVLNDGITIERAQVEAKTVGLTTPAYEEKALAYIAKQRAAGAEVSVRPGINDSFLDPSLELNEWLGRFEIESREVYADRDRVLAACNIKPGFRVADIGAGTGFYSRLFSAAVGEAGWVYSVDISPRFLEHINAKTQQEKLNNVTTVLCSDRSIGLPPNSVDVAFICDTYHHFEYPASTLASIHRAVKPGGTLIVVDFNRIPGESREFILGHVGAGKEVFQNEIVTAGFRYLDEVKVPMFQENYLIRFRKD